MIRSCWKRTAKVHRRHLLLAHQESHPFLAKSAGVVKTAGPQRQTRTMSTNGNFRRGFMSMSKPLVAAPDGGPAGFFFVSSTARRDPRTAPKPMPFGTRKEAQKKRRGVVRLPPLFTSRPLRATNHRPALATPFCFTVLAASMSITAATGHHTAPSFNSLEGWRRANPVSYPQGVVPVSIDGKEKKKENERREIPGGAQTPLVQTVSA